MKNIFLLYLDPGTGSLLLYAILGIFTTLLFLLKKLIYLVKNIFLGSSREIKNYNTNYNIVIHSEGGRYFHNFKSIIEEFIKNEKKIVYVTPDKTDPIFNISSPFLEIIHFDTEYKTISFLNNISANIVISTTPHLDIYMWKKSKNVKKYVHIFHAPTSVDLYEKYALSFYDIIICAVPQTEQTQKFLDNKRKLPIKSYYTAGCPYFDDIIIQNNDLKNELAINTILYAPTWGNRSSINSMGQKIIETLLLNNYKIIFRPHPQSFISDKEKIEEIIKKYSNCPNFELDTNKVGLESMKKSDLLISDYSGIIFDYYYLIKKPIFLTNIDLNLNGYEVEDLPVEFQYDIPISKLITHELSYNDMENLNIVIKDKINKYKHDEEKTSLPNFGSAGKKIFNILMKIEQELK